MSGKRCPLRMPGYRAVKMKAEFRAWRSRWATGMPLSACCAASVCPIRSSLLQTEVALFTCTTIESMAMARPGGVNVRQLLTNLTKMKQYNLIFLNCSDDTNSASLLNDPKVRKNLVNYVAAGGRMYVTDWSYDFVGQPPEFAPYICFNDDKPCTDLSPHGRFSATGAFRTGSVNPLWAEIDQSHLGGRNLAAWMSMLPDPSPGGKVKVVDDVGSWVLMRQTAQDEPSIHRQRGCGAPSKGSAARSPSRSTIQRRRRAEKSSTRPTTPASTATAACSPPTAPRPSSSRKSKCWNICNLQGDQLLHRPDRLVRNLGGGEY